MRLVLPSTLVRIVLAESRERGLPFEHAWQLAVRALPRSMQDDGEWRTVLGDVKHAFATAYVRAKPAARLADRELPSRAISQLRVAVAQNVSHNGSSEAVHASRSLAS